MPTQSSIHFYLDWAKGRIDEMDAALASLEGKVGEVETDARANANQVLADLRKKRDDFRDTVKKQSEANESAWISARAKLESEAPSRSKLGNTWRALATKSSTSKRHSSFNPRPN